MRGLWLWLCTFPAFSNFALFVFICQFQGFPFWCNSCTCPPPGDNRCAERKPAVWIWILDWVITVFVGSGCCSGLKEDCIIYIFGFWTLDFEKCNR